MRRTVMYENQYAQGKRKEKETGRRRFTAVIEGADLCQDEPGPRQVQNN